MRIIVGIGSVTFVISFFLFFKVFYLLILWTAKFRTPKCYHCEAVEQYLLWSRLFFNFTQFVILEKFISFGLSIVMSERVNMYAKIYGLFVSLRSRRALQAFLLLLVSPPMILFLLSLAFNVLVSDGNIDSGDLLSLTMDTVRGCVTSSVREARMLGTWSYAMTCLGILPNWLLFWYVAWQ